MKEVSTLLATLAPKACDTGTVGYFANGKVVIDGQTYQGQAAAWLIGSKNDPKIKSAKADQKVVLEKLTGLAAGLTPKTFRSTKTGYYVQGKLVDGAERFQASITLVKIG
jgi:hypothetical protein